MNRIAPLVVSLTGLFLLSATASEKRPNVLLICVDDLKPLLGCYGHQQIKTPHIDRLAARGMRFERAYCNQAVCAPSRNALMTGLRPSTVGIYDLGTNFRQATPDIVTLAQCFKNSGYRAEAVGKIFHVGHGNNEDPRSWSVPHFKGKSISYTSPENQQGLTREEAFFSNYTGRIGDLPRGAALEAADVDDSGYPDGVLAEEALRRLQAAKTDPEKPWLLCVGFLKPHLPFCAPKKYWDLYDRSAFALPPLQSPPKDAPAFAATNWGELRQYNGIPTSGPLSEEKGRELLHGYHAAVSYIDAQIGRLLDGLDAAGLAKNTIVVLWGDHGWHLGDHGQWSKHSNYEQAAHIPLLVVAPGAKANSSSPALVETVDIYPTLTELAGVQAPQGLDGTSFAAQLKNPASPGKESILHVFPRGELMGRAIRTDRYRLVEWKKIGSPAESAQIELYDYETDPGESQNLAAGQPAVVAQLRALLARYPEATPQIRSGPDRNVMFKDRDKDNDGSLTRAEFLADQPDPKEAPKRFERFDTDQSGDLNREEFVTMGRKR